MWFILNEKNNTSLIQKVLYGKSYGEKSYIEYALDILNNNMKYSFDNFPNLKSIFKVGGRYFLNNHFDFQLFDNDCDI